MPLTPVRHVFAAPRAEQFQKAAHLEAAFHAYAVKLGCGIVHDEITANEEQASMLHNWWMENRL